MRHDLGAHKSGIDKASLAPKIGISPLTMRALLVIGILVLIFGIASLFISIPHRQNNGIKVGGAEIGIQTRTSERFPLPASIAIIVGGIVLIAVGGRSGPR